MTEQTIVVVNDPEYDHWREYHFGVQVSDSLIERLHAGFVFNDGDYYRGKIGELGWNLMCELMKINGVVEMCFHTHSITIYKEGSMDWLELGPKILEVLKRELVGDEVQIIEILSSQVHSGYFHEDDSAQPGFVMPQ